MAEEDRPPFALERACAGIRVHAHDQFAAQLLGPAKIANMTNVQQIKTALMSIPFEARRPSCVIAHTVKGKGVSFMENKVLWHYRAPDREELAKALAELEVFE